MTEAHRASHSSAVGATAARRAYWRATIVVTVALLAVWFAVTFAVPYFARELDFPFLGSPFSFYMAAQGALVVYVAAVVVYLIVMRRLDRRHGRDERP